MITVALTATIDATAERVWRAVADPDERACWDDRILGEIRLPVSASRSMRTRSRVPDLGSPAIRSNCWRFRLSDVPLVMIEETLRIEERERLFGRTSIGSLHFAQTLTLHAEYDRSGPRVRLGMKLVGANRVAVIGELIPRIEAQRFLIEYADTTLRQVRKHCEASEHARTLSNFARLRTLVCGAS